MESVAEGVVVKGTDQIASEIRVRIVLLQEVLAAIEGKPSDRSINAVVRRHREALGLPPER